MTSWKLDHVCAQPVSGYPLCPLPANQAVLAAYHVSARNRGKLAQREWQGGSVPRLRSDLLDDRLDDSVVTVGVEQCSKQFEIDPPHAELCIRFGATLAKIQIHHIRLVGHLIVEVPADLCDQGTQVYQVPHRPTSRNQRDRQTAKRVPHNHSIVAIPVQGSAHHIRIVFEARRAVLNRQVHRDYLVSRLTEKRSQTLPTPRTVPRAMHESERRHAASVMMMSDLAGRNRQPRGARPDPEDVHHDHRHRRSSTRRRQRQPRDGSPRAAPDTGTH
jgi:hypothetical protein